VIWRSRFTRDAEAENMIGQYVEGFYNPKYRHSTTQALCSLKIKPRKHGDYSLFTEASPIQHDTGIKTND